MKYYCENCGFEHTESRTDVRFWRKCPSCGIGVLYSTPIPAYETVAQWEERRQEEYPDTAPVYYLQDNEWGLEKGWSCCSYCAVPDSARAVVVATEAGAPLDNWRPE